MSHTSRKTSDSAAAAHSIYVNHGKRYQYQPLADPGSSIRLLKVKRKQARNGLIQCQLFEATTSQEYTCLSYVWGQENDGGGPFQILVNGETLAVRYNLHAFLRVAQSKYRNRNIWIDAISIDQRNIKERNHQVQQMGVIYSRAKEVIAWLGDSKAAAKGLAWIARGTKHTLNFKIAPSYVKLIRDEDNVRFYCKETETAAETYLSRAWVTQEIKLARHLTLLAHKTELEVVREAMSIYEKLRMRAFLNRWAFDLYFRLDEHIWKEDSGQKRPILSLLGRYANKKCSIKRDRIFSLLSLTLERPNLEVDYNLSDKKLLQKILQISILRPCLCLLKYALPGIDIDVMSKEDWEDRYFVRLTMKPVANLSQLQQATYNGICPECNQCLHITWPDRHTDVFFCLDKVCSYLSGHLFLKKPNPLAHAADLQHVRHGYENRSLGRTGVLLDYSKDWQTNVYTFYLSLMVIMELTSTLKPIRPGWACSEKVLMVRTGREIEFLGP